MERFRRSWQLAKASWAVLQADRELLVFPLVSFLALVAVLITFAIPVVLVGGFTDPETGDYNVAGLVLAFLFYVVAYSVSFYFNTGLVGAAMIRLQGGDPTVRDGFRIANSRLPAIIGYAIIAATVGMVLRAISERAGFIGQIIIGFIGLAWSILTFLVVPVLVVENVGPIDAVKRSGALLRKTWGEQLIGGGGIGLVFGLILFLVILVGIFFTVLLAGISPVLFVFGLVATTLAAGGVALVGGALGGIYTASLYQYATTGAAGQFGTEVMEAAFSQKKPSRLGGMLGR